METSHSLAFQQFLMNRKPNEVGQTGLWAVQLWSTLVLRANHTVKNRICRITLVVNSHTAQVDFRCRKALWALAGRVENIGCASHGVLGIKQSFRDLNFSNANTVP